MDKDATAAKEEKPPHRSNRIGGIDAKKLKSYIERIERVEEEKSGLGADIRDIYSEAKVSGFDPKTMRKILQLRKQEEKKREEEESLLETYKRALGIGPLFDDV